VKRRYLLRRIVKDKQVFFLSTNKKGEEMYPEVRDAQKHLKK
jgi:hypothetical protein